jgi:small subunit ribosomal protein S16
MLVIRLLRTGKKNQPTYKIVVTDKENPPRGGRFVEEVGFYNPKTKERVLKKERIQYWVSQGVKPSDTVYNMLVSEGVVEGGKKDVHKKSKKEAPAESAEKPVEEAKAEAAPVQEQKPAESPAMEEKKEEPQEQKPEQPIQEQPEAALKQPAEPAPKEEPLEVKPEEKPEAAEEKKEEAPAEQKPEEAPKEEQK